MHPLLASGMRTNPLAGMMLIQQPGRLTAFTFVCLPVARSHIVGFPARKKNAVADAEIDPQP